jgi:hypothetical protein
VFDVQQAHLARGAKVEALDDVEDDYQEGEADCDVAGGDCKYDALGEADEKYCCC